MKARDERSDVLPEAPAEGSSPADPTRRGFLRQVAVAGVSSLTLAALVGENRSNAAEVVRPKGEMLRSDYWTIEVVAINGAPGVQLSSTFNGGTPLFATLNANGTAHFRVPLGGFGLDKAVHGAWYVPFDNIQNLTQWRTLDIGPTADGESVDLNVRPVSGVKGASLTLQVLVLHDA